MSYEQRKQNLVAIKGLTYVFSSLLRSLYDRKQVRAISETQTDDVLHNHTNKVANCPSIRISTFCQRFSRPGTSCFPLSLYLPRALSVEPVVVERYWNVRLRYWVRYPVVLRLVGQLTLENLENTFLWKIGNHSPNNGVVNPRRRTSSLSSFSYSEKFYVLQPVSVYTSCYSAD